MNEKENLIYFITGNNNKFNEVLKIFNETGLNFILKQKDLDPIESQSDSIKDVALFKLKNVQNMLDASFFVEDAGFFVDEPLNGFPGVYSSYVFKTIGNKGILNLIHDFKQTEAHFGAAIALYFKPLNEILIFEGEIKGKVSDKIRGNQGFGFDPIFLPNINPDHTFAEISTEEKNKISHRGIALKKLIEFLQKNE